MKRSLACLYTFLLAITLCFAGEVEYTYHFTPPGLTQSRGIQTFRFENCLNTALPGQPVLPYREVKLMLPPGESAVSMELFFGDESPIPGKFDLPPQQGVRPVSEGPSGVFLKDEALYRSTAEYPADPKGRLLTSFLNGRSFAFSSFTPLRYIPATGEARYYATARVVIHTAPTPEAEAALGNLSLKVAYPANFADNAEADASYRSLRKPLTDPYEILIITPTNYAGSFEALRKTYLTEGMRSEVASLETITASMPGADVPEKIRNYIISEYQSRGIQQVILGGDAELIPARGLYCHVQSGSGYTDISIPSSIYYSGLDGNWNEDGDALWGEAGDNTLSPVQSEEADLAPEISIGRLPFSTLAELNAMLHKSISYQTSPVDGEFRNILLAGEWLYAAPYLTWGSYYMELLVGNRNDNGYSTTGIPAEYPVDRMYDESTPWTKQDLMNHLNQGRPMLNHVGHANEVFVMKLMNSDITNANFSGLNGITHNYTLVYTHGCDCGAFDYIPSDCIGEKMLSIDNFAAAFIGNTRYGWFNEGTSEGPSEHLHREFMDALFNSGMTRIGSAHAESKIVSAPWVTAPGQWEPGALRWVFYDCTVLGDPVMAAFTDNPKRIQTSLPAGISAGTSAFSVSVNSDGNPSEGMTCVVIENGTLLGKSVTDATGQASLDLSSPITDPANTTLYVSGVNTVPQAYGLSPKTYTWKATSGNWKTASSWNPERTSPAANDILIFDGNVAPAPAISLDFSTAENTGCIRLINQAAPVFTATLASHTLTIGNEAAEGPALDIAAGCTLTLSASQPITLIIPENNTAVIHGNVVFRNAAHRMLASGTGSLHFGSGSVFTAGSGFSGNPFGTSIAGAAHFASESEYIQAGGDSPFGFAGSAPVTTFDAGSHYRFTAASGSPDITDRTYGNLEINSTSAALSDLNGTGNLQLQNLTLSSGNCGFNLNGEISLKGNLSVNGGAVLNFNPAASGTLLLNGSAPQLISVSGILGSGDHATLNSSNTAGVRLSGPATFHHITVSSGTFTLSPDASLITSGNVSGSIRAERPIAHDNGWHFLSSPVAAQPVQPAFAPELMNNSFDFYRWSPTEDLTTGLPWINLRDGSGVNSGFDPAHPDAPRFSTASGYLVAYSPAYVNLAGNDELKTFTGVPLTGSISMPVTASANAWNLVGNPYPSSLNFDLLSQAAGSLLSTPACWTILPGGNYASYLSGSGGINGASAEIAPMQGFFVEAASTGNIPLSNSMRTHSGQIWLKDGPALPSRLRLQVAAIGGGKNDEVLIHRSAGFSGSTGAEKMFAAAEGQPALFTTKAGKKFGIDQAAEKTESVGLGFIAPAAGTYILKVAANSFAEQLVLEDLKTGARQDLREHPDYSFTSAPADDENRFVLHIGSAYGTPENEKNPGIILYTEGNRICIRQTIPGSGNLRVFSTTGQLLASEVLQPVPFQTIESRWHGMAVVHIQTEKGVSVYPVILP
jgi:hypothetical protein